MAERKKPLDISYSLRIGTSIYHVLGKRRQSRKTNYDYYIVEDKFIRSKSNRKSSRPRYIVDEPNEKKKPVRKPKALDEKTIKRIVDEAIDAEREKIVAALRAAVAEENEAAYQAHQNEEKTSIDLIQQTVKETLDAQKQSAVALEDRLAQTVEREIRKGNKKSKQEDDERIKVLFTEQNQVLIDKINQNQQQATTELSNKIRTVVVKTLQEERENDKPLSQQDLKDMENRLNEKILEMAPKYKDIKLLDNLNLSTSSVKKQNAQNENIVRDNNRASNKSKPPSINSPIEEPPTISHIRDSDLDLNKDDD